MLACFILPSMLNLSYQKNMDKKIGKYISSKKKFTLYSLKIMLVSLLPGSIYYANPYLNLIMKFNKLAEKNGVA